MKGPGVSPFFLSRPHNSAEPATSSLNEDGSPAARRVKPKRGAPNEHRPAGQQRLLALGSFAALVFALIGAIAWFQRGEAIAQRTAAEVEKGRAERALKTAVDGLIFELAQGLQGGGLPIVVVRNLLGRAETIVARLIGSAPEDPALLRIQAAAYAEFARTYAAVGDTQSQGALAERSLAIVHRLLEADPSNADFAGDFLISLSKVADARLAQRDFAGALRAYEEGRAIIRRVSGADQPDPASARGLSFGLSKVGDVRVSQNDLVGAGRAYEVSLAIDRRLAESDPSDANFAHLFGSLN